MRKTGMDCRETRERLSDYRDRAIPPAEAEAVDAHLRACRECAGIDRSLAEMREGLRRLPPLAAALTPVWSKFRH